MKKRLLRTFYQRVSIAFLPFLFSAMVVTVVKGKGDTLTIASWNIQNLGKSKSDQELSYMARMINPVDVIAIQEVVAGEGGAQAVARLHDALERMGTHWDYCISDPTSGLKGSVERYAYFWKPSRVKRLGHPWLDHFFSVEIDREPYMSTFIFQTDTFTLTTLHAIPKSKQPETEIKYLKFFPQKYLGHTLIFMGDFNCPQSNSVFGPLKSMGYPSVFSGRKTTLKRGCAARDCLSSEYDNLFYPASKMKLVNSSVLQFQLTMPDGLAPENISDHLPIVGWFLFKH